VQSIKLNKKQIETVIKEVLLEGPMEINDIVDKLYYEKGLLEYEVKEAILRLRYKRDVKPNRMWEMELVDSSSLLEEIN
jgi:hypothetical protein